MTVGSPDVGVPCPPSVSETSQAVNSAPTAPETAEQTEPAEIPPPNQAGSADGPCLYIGKFGRDSMLKVENGHER